MPKLIQSVAHQHGDAERLKLERRKRELENEIRRIDAILQQKYYDVEKKAQSPKSPTNNTEPSYLRATNASRNRSVLADNQPMDTTKSKVVSIHGITYTFQDGRLIGRPPCYDRKDWNCTKPTNLYQHHTEASGQKIKPTITYERHTEASRQRIKPRVRYIDYESLKSPISPSGTIDMDKSTTSCGNDSVTLVEISETVVETGAPVVEDASDVESEWDDDFEAMEDEIPFAQREYLVIPSKVGYRILFRAFRLAQDIFYNAARKHWPKLFKRMCPGGPHEVRFGYSELESYSVSTAVTRVPGGRSPFGPSGRIYNMISLRNAICHFGSGANSWDVSTYIHYVAQVLELALEVDDKPRAKKAVALRRELHAEIRKVLDDFENLEPLKRLPFSLPWKGHHVEAFQMYLRNPSDHERQLPQFRRAAEQFGSLYPEYYPRTYSWVATSVKQDEWGGKLPVFDSEW
ncbi:hypothetical protein F4809DRAFT_642097 [Biscogniauxia mediterranea]|nr:hypothetical protein F4809DRAFT_642097 [Biscogniauxia mediterranea]